MEGQLEVLKTVREYIERLYDSVNDTVENFKQDNIQEGYNLLTQIIDGLQWCIEAIHLTRECQKEPIALNNITPLLSDMIEGLENNDIVLLKDLLEYEIKVTLEEWHEKIGKVTEI